MTNKGNFLVLERKKRSFRGNSPLKLEYEHHCGKCGAHLDDSRSRSTCIGKHVEPCYKYHGTMHLLGRAHECTSCKMADEMHHSRHKAILQQVREINKLDEPSTPPKASCSLADALRLNESTTTLNLTATPQSSEKITKRERKKLRKSGNGVNKLGFEIEAFPRVNLEAVSQAIHGAVFESKGAWEGTYNYNHPLPAAENVELAKARPEGEGDPEGGDVEPTTPQVTPPKPKGNKPRQRKSARRRDEGTRPCESRKYVSPTTKSKSDIYDGVDPLILKELGVTANAANHSGKRKALFSKLIASIKEDVDIIRKEEEEKAVREEAFWSRVGKPALEAMTKTREDIDWATGQRKKGGG